MRTLEVKLPDTVDLKEFDLLMRIAAKLYEDAILSSGQAAAVAGVSKRTFIELLGKYGVSAFGETPQDIKTFLGNAENYNR